MLSPFLFLIKRALLFWLDLAFLSDLYRPFNRRFFYRKLGMLSAGNIRAHADEHKKEGKGRGRRITIRTEINESAGFCFRTLQFTHDNKKTKQTFCDLYRSVAKIFALSGRFGNRRVGN